MLLLLREKSEKYGVCVDIYKKCIEYFTVDMNTLPKDGLLTLVTVNVYSYIHTCTQLCMLL